MSYDTGNGYGNYEPPKEKKRHPLTRQDTKDLYRTAVEYPDREAELCVRVLLDYGLRIGELIHSRAPWVGKERNSKIGDEIWRISIPRTEYCFGGTGGKGEQKNESGVDLHHTDQPCGDCVNRPWDGRVNGYNEKDDGWLTERQAQEYDWAPKREKSASKVWQIPGLDESADTARKLKEFLKSKNHQQWPHTQNPVRNRVQKIVDKADLELPDRTHGKVVPHALRHTYGCRLVELGANEGIGMQQMRHRNSDVFQWYSEVRGNRVVAALDEAASNSDSLLDD